MKKILFLFGAFISLTCNAQTWDSLSSGIGGTNSLVRAFTIWNGNLIVGGAFTVAGDSSANDIAVRNGTTWSTIGTGMNGSIYSLTVYNGNLFAGGAFTTAGGHPAIGIAEWNGTTWAAVGGGMGGNNPDVLALSVYNGNLIAGGIFTIAGGNAAKYIAQWNGTTWSVLGTGLSYSGSVSDPGVWALLVWNGNLFAGGEYTFAGGERVNDIAKWNGITWDSLGSGMGGNYPIVGTLDTFQNELIAGGTFTLAGGHLASNVAKWSGSIWSPLGSGTNMYDLYSLANYNGNLIAGGLFDTAGGNAAHGIAEWNGSVWSELAGGMQGNQPYWDVEALTLWNGNLFAGGQFDSAGNNPANRIAKLNTLTGINGAVESNQVKVYPNPNTGIFTISLLNAFQNAGIVIYNTMGQKVYEGALNPNATQINISNEPTGLYLYRVTTMDGQIISSGKVVIQ